MSRRIEKTSDALRDLEEQAAFLGVEDLDLELRFLDAADETFRQLLQTPRMGKPCEFRNAELSGLRRWFVRGFPRHLIFYREGSDGIQVVRVLHGARDVAAHLDAEPMRILCERSRLQPLRHPLRELRLDRFFDPLDPVLGVGVGAEELRG
jgi:toxin ParE1/3/4